MHVEQGRLQNVTKKRPSAPSNHEDAYESMRRKTKGMLSSKGNNALDYREQCSIPIRSYPLDPIEQCFGP